MCLLTNMPSLYPFYAPQRHHHSKRQLFAAWRLRCHQSSLLQIALGRLRRRVLAASFLGWQRITMIKHRRQSLLNVSFVIVWAHVS
jgi:hypothetical protein